MTSNANPPEDSRRPLAPLAFAGVLLAGVAAVLANTGGCSKPPSGIKNDDDRPVVKGDPWKVAGQRLRKDADSNAVKQALGALGSELNTPDKEALPALSEPDLKKLAELVPLTDADRDELRGNAFTPYDSAYIADCLYLRDCARSLALTGFPPEAQADQAFAWVCRQVYLHPWVRIPNRPEGGTALPPTAVLRRGSGSGLERMYIFLALLQQLELDGCLIGPPDARDQPAGFPILTPDKKAFATGAPRGPFWAVGVRVGGDVRLYDPWRGRPFPVTLAQLRANPDAAKAWFADPANVSGATLDDAKQATCFLAVPVNALSPRMAVLDTKLKADLGAKLSYNPAALRAAFADPKPAFWNPPDEPQLPSAFTYGRVARSFLPRELGGTDGGAPGARLYDAYRFDQLPPAVFRAPNALVPAARDRLGATAATILGQSFVEPPNPRERIQRGQFQDAATDLVTKQDQFSGGIERLRLNKDADERIQAWSDAANELYDELGRAQFQKNKDAEANQLAVIEAHWKADGARYLLDRASSEVGLAEATYLLALCKHELAERSQARADRAPPADAARLKQEASDTWKTALSAWQNYEQRSGAHAGFPGRAAHAQTLAARAEKLASAK